MPPPSNRTNNQASVIAVEFLGFGGCDDNDQESCNNGQQQQEDQQRKNNSKQGYNTNSPYQVLGVGALTQQEVDALAAEKREQIGGR